MLTPLLEVCSVYRLAVEGGFIGAVILESDTGKNNFLSEDNVWMNHIEISHKVKQNLSMTLFSSQLLFAVFHALFWKRGIWVWTRQIPGLMDLEF